MADLRFSALNAFIAFAANRDRFTRVTVRDDNLWALVFGQEKGPAGKPAGPFE
jgi:hypothetical protein